MLRDGTRIFLVPSLRLFFYYHAPEHRKTLVAARVLE
jgi:hypothetical protein